MYIKTITYDENKRPITFKDIKFGEIFRTDGEYYIKIKPVKNSLFPANAVNLKDGGCTYMEEEAKASVYTVNTLTLSESKFKSEMEINE